MIDDNLFLSTPRNRLNAPDASAGRSCMGFGQNGMVALVDDIGDTAPRWYAVTAAPAIGRGIAVVDAQVNDNQAEDASSGMGRRYDAVTEEMAWAKDPCNPQLHGKPAEGQVYTRGTPNMWTMAAGDEGLRYMCLPLGNSAVDYSGAERSAAENEYFPAIAAIDAARGDFVTHFHPVHYDLWEYALGWQSTLVDFPTDVGRVPALVLPSKQGQTHVLNCATGKSVFPVKDRPAPTGRVTFVAVTTVNKFRAVHVEIGERMWQTDLPAGGPPTPITYEAERRQSVVIYPGGHPFKKTEIGYQLLAYSLPGVE